MMNLSCDSSNLQLSQFPCYLFRYLDDSTGFRIPFLVSSWISCCPLRCRFVTSIAFVHAHALSIRSYMILSLLVQLLSLVLYTSSKVYRTTFFITIHTLYVL